MRVKIIITIIVIVGLILIGKYGMMTQSKPKILDIQHWQTAKGIPVNFVQAPNLPMFDIQIAFDAGSARDGQQNGLAYLTNALISEGTDKMDADQVAEQFENVGAEFTLNSYCDMALVSVRSLSQPEIVSSVMETLTHILNKPAFLEPNFKREQAQLLIGLKYEAQRPDKLARKTFYEKIYPSHMYGNWNYGREETVQKLTPVDVKAFYKKYYVARNAVISIVGALSLKEAKSMAEQVSDALETGEVPASLPAVTDITYSAPEKILFPSEQTHIIMGAPGMKRGDPDFFALSVGNHILGGNSTVTRIFNEIRHKRGLAYDVHSYFIPMRERGPFLVGLQTKTEQAPEALTVLQSTLKKFVTEGPTPQEVEEAKLNILGGYALLFDNNKAILSKLTTLGFYKLPLDYYDTYKQNIEKVSSASIQETFKRRIHPDNMLVVMVGR